MIESIFLDEGFGTLDPQTLDTVATAIEELGASGRMVGNRDAHPRAGRPDAGPSRGHQDGEHVDRRAGRGLTMRFSVESWSPEYGVATDVDLLDDASERVDAAVERPLADWAPIAPSAATTPERIMFVDGVRRIDARVWIHDTDRVYAGVCASVAAGVVTCNGARAGGHRLRHPPGAHRPCRVRWQQAS